MRRRKTVTLWHGTDVDSARAILSEGLKADVCKYDMSDASGERDYNPSLDDEPGFVYVTTHRRLALGFAQVRTKFYRTPVGRAFSMPGYFARHMPDQRKHSGPHKPDARAALVKIELPADWPHDCDPQCFLGYRVPGQIPAQYVKGAFTLNNRALEPLPQFAAPVAPQFESSLNAVAAAA